MRALMFLAVFFLVALVGVGFYRAGFSSRRKPRPRGPAPHLRWTKTKSTRMSRA